MRKKNPGKVLEGEELKEEIEEEDKQENKNQNAEKKNKCSI